MHGSAQLHMYIRDVIKSIIIVKVGICIGRPHTSGPGEGSTLSPSPVPPALPVQAALIMQVLSLSDEQILMLPPDQRNSILKLKEQIARSN